MTGPPFTLADRAWLRVDRVEGRPDPERVRRSGRPPCTRSLIRRYAHRADRAVRTTDHHVSP